MTNPEADLNRLATVNEVNGFVIRIGERFAGAFALKGSVKSGHELPDLVSAKIHKPTLRQSSLYGLWNKGVFEYSPPIFNPYEGLDTAAPASVLAAFSSPIKGQPGSSRNASITIVSGYMGQPPQIDARSGEFYDRYKKLTPEELAAAMGTLPVIDDAAAIQEDIERAMGYDPGHLTLGELHGLRDLAVASINPTTVHIISKTQELLR